MVLLLQFQMFLLLDEKSFLLSNWEIYVLKNLFSVYDFRMVKVKLILTFILAFQAIIYFSVFRLIGL